MTRFLNFIKRNTFMIRLMTFYLIVFTFIYMLRPNSDMFYNKTPYMYMFYLYMTLTILILTIIYSVIIFKKYKTKRVRALIFLCVFITAPFMYFDNPKIGLDFIKVIMFSISIISVFIFIAMLINLYKSKFLRNLTYDAIFLYCISMGAYYFVNSVNGFPKLIDYIKMFESTVYENDKVIKNTKNINLEDEKILNEELNAQGKDIIIILDLFKDDNRHGDDVTNYFLKYFKNKKIEPDIKIIKLSFNQDTYREEIPLCENRNIEYIALFDNSKVPNESYLYEQRTKEFYPFEKYMQKIRELNPNSKIVLSLSLHIPYFKNDIIRFSKTYDFKISQAYFNNDFFYKELGYKNEVVKTYFEVMFWFNFIMDKTNTLIVSRLDFRPLFFVDYITVDDFKLDKDINKFLKDISGSKLTPILGYEYYLNKNSNYIQRIEEDFYLFD